MTVYVFSVPRLFPLSCVPRLVVVSLPVADILPEKEPWQALQLTAYDGLACETDANDIASTNIVINKNLLFITKPLQKTIFLLFSSFTFNGRWRKGAEFLRTIRRLSIIFKWCYCDGGAMFFRKCFNRKKAFYRIDLLL